MADALEDQIGDLIAAELNDSSQPWAGFFNNEIPAVTAVRTRAPFYSIQTGDLAGLRVAIVPLTLEITKLARNMRQLNYGFGIDLQRQIDPGDDTELKALSAVAEQIHDWFDNGHVIDDGTIAAPGPWICLMAERKDIYSLPQLYAEQIWETLINVTIAGAKVSA